jgi:hypothetical protein
MDHGISVWQQDAEENSWNEVATGWTELHEMFHNFYSSPNIVVMIKLRSVRWAEHVVYMRDAKFRQF